MAEVGFITDAVAVIDTSRRTGRRVLVVDAGGVRPRRGRGLKGRGHRRYSCDSLIIRVSPRMRRWGDGASGHRPTGRQDRRLVAGRQAVRGPCRRATRPGLARPQPLRAVATGPRRVPRTYGAGQPEQDHRFYARVAHVGYEPRAAVVRDCVSGPHPRSASAAVQRQREPGHRAKVPDPLGVADAVRARARTARRKAEPTTGAVGDRARPRLGLYLVRRHRRSSDHGHARTALPVLRPPRPPRVPAVGRCGPHPTREAHQHAVRGRWCGGAAHASVTSARESSQNPQRSRRREGSTEPFAAISRLYEIAHRNDACLDEKRLSAAESGVRLVPV